MIFNDLINNNKLKMIGRTYQKDNKLFINFSGSGVKFKVLTKTLVLKLYGTKFDDKNSCPYISVLVDNDRYDYAIDEISKEIKLSLSNDYHIIQILKRTESSVSFAAIEDIIADKFLKVEDSYDYNIEFYGDSLTCGFGNLSNNPEEKFKTETESFLDGYSYLVAKALNANYSAICVSGFPIYKSRWNEGFQIDSIADMISICDYSEDMNLNTINPWDNNKFKPDLVIINLGTNDCSYFTKGEKWVDELIEKYKDFEAVLTCSEFKKELDNLEKKIITFLDDLFKIYKDVKVIWALGLIEVDKHIQEVFDRVLTNYNNKNLYQFNFHVIEKCNERGAVWHPSKKMHIEGSKQLLDFIRNNVLGEK